MNANINRFLHQMCLCNWLTWRTFLNRKSWIFFRSWPKNIPHKCTVKAYRKQRLSLIFIFHPVYIIFEYFKINFLVEDFLCNWTEQERQTVLKMSITGIFVQYVIYYIIIFSIFYFLPLKAEPILLKTFSIPSFQSTREKPSLMIAKVFLVSSATAW